MMDAITAERIADLRQISLDAHNARLAGDHINRQELGAAYAAFEKAIAPCVIIDLLDEIEWLRNACDNVCRVKDSVVRDCAVHVEINDALRAERDRYRDMAASLAVTLRQICIGDNCDEWAAIQAGREELLKPAVAAILNHADNTPGDGEKTMGDA